MQAIVQERYGSADVLELREVPEPVAGEGEVVVRVHAAAVGRAAWHLMTGLPYMVRPALGLLAPRQRVFGVDLAGRVASLGPGARRFQVGDRVYGMGRGTFATYACTGEDRLAPMPANLTFEQAAAVPDSGLTALQALRDQGRVQPGQRVLVVGASGGVGILAVQLATAFGARVTGVCSAAKADAVRAAGAGEVLDHAEGDLTRHGLVYDLVVDIGGRRRLSVLRRLVTPDGTLVLVGGEGGNRLTGGFGRQLRAMALSPFTGQRLRAFVASERGADLEFLTGLIEEGRLTPVVDRTYALAQTAEAVRRLESGAVTGKVVVTID